MNAVSVRLVVPNNEALLEATREIFRQYQASLVIDRASRTSKANWPALELVQLFWAWLGRLDRSHLTPHCAAHREHEYHSSV